MTIEEKKAIALYRQLPLMERKQILIALHQSLFPDERRHSFERIFKQSRAQEHDEL